MKTFFIATSEGIPRQASERASKRARRRERDIYGILIRAHLAKNNFTLTHTHKLVAAAAAFEGEESKKATENYVNINLLAMDGCVYIGKKIVV
jgi:hypothetical protein